jgi:hypothetical protein
LWKRLFLPHSRNQTVFTKKMLMKVVIDQVDVDEAEVEVEVWEEAEE